MTYSQFKLLQQIARKHNVSFEEVFEEMEAALNEADIVLYDFLDALL